MTYCLRLGGLEVAGAAAPVGLGDGVLFPSFAFHQVVAALPY